ncbi:MAG: class I SAM-dependent methyltransferase [Thermodesulfobacteriota bacterium]
MNWEKFKNSCRKRIRNSYNFFISSEDHNRDLTTDLLELNEIKARSRKRTSINEHLETLFLESLSLKPKLIVELGVGGGESTFVLARVARLCGSLLVSLDINDRSHVSDYPDWVFIQQDDVAFAREFAGWCQKQGVEPRIDVLFIDTSHYFDHTLKEIEAYFPFLADHAKVFFHDTNLSNFFFREDGSLDIGWDNDRGVIRALEVYFRKTFNEKEAFTDFISPWIIKHNPYCCGFTILEKVGFLAQES